MLRLRWLLLLVPIITLANAPAVPESSTEVAVYNGGNTADDSFKTDTTPEDEPTATTTTDDDDDDDNLVPESSTEVAVYNGGNTADDSFKTDTTPEDEPTATTTTDDDDDDDNLVCVANKIPPYKEDIKWGDIHVVEMWPTSAVVGNNSVKVNQAVVNIQHPTYNKRSVVRFDYYYKWHYNRILQIIMARGGGDEDRLKIKCGRKVKKGEDLYNKLKKKHKWHNGDFYTLDNTFKDTKLDLSFNNSTELTLQVGSSLMQILNSAGILWKGTCPVLNLIKPLSNIFLGVMCGPGDVDCGSISACTSECKMVNMRELYQGGVSWMLVDGVLETDILHLHHPLHNDWYLGLSLYNIMGGDHVGGAGILPHYNNNTGVIMDCGGSWTNWTTINHYPPSPLRIKLQVGSKWVRMTDTTGGEELTLGQANCTNDIPGFPDLWLHMGCSFGDDCGEMSISCQTDNGCVVYQVMVGVVALVIVVSVGMLCWCWWTKRNKRMAHRPTGNINEADPSVSVAFQPLEDSEGNN